MDWKLTLRIGSNPSTSPFDFAQDFAAVRIPHYKLRMELSPVNSLRSHGAGTLCWNGKEQYGEDLAMTNNGVGTP